MDKASGRKDFSKKIYKKKKKLSLDQVIEMIRDGRDDELVDLIDYEQLPPHLKEILVQDPK